MVDGNAPQGGKLGFPKPRSRGSITGEAMVRETGSLACFGFHELRRLLRSFLDMLEHLPVMDEGSTD